MLRGKKNIGLIDFYSGNKGLFFRDFKRLATMWQDRGYVKQIKILEVLRFAHLILKNPMNFPTFYYVISPYNNVILT